MNEVEEIVPPLVSDILNDRQKDITNSVSHQTSMAAPGNKLESCSLAKPLPKQATQSVSQSSGPYTAFPLYRQKLILGLVTAAGFLGPLAGGIYLPALPVLEQEFRVSSTAINATVSVFMVTFAIGVSSII